MRLLRFQFHAYKQQFINILASYKHAYAVCAQAHEQAAH